MTRTTWLVIGIVLALAAVALSFWAYPQLPERVPSHWDWNGNVTANSSRFTAVVLLPAIVVFTWLLMLVLPLISPRGFRLDQFANAFYEVIIAIIAVFLVIHFVLFRAEIGGSAPPNAMIFAPIGVLLVIIGNLMGKFKKNFFIGVRTPWTLASDEVWLRTNRLGGRLMVIGGLLLIAASSFPSWAVPALIVVVIAISLVPIVYSYVLYRRIEGFGPNGQEGSV